MALALEGRTRVVWDALLTGVPFGIFKMGTGYFLWTFHGVWLAVLLIGWGIIDLGLNLIAAVWPRPLPYCLLSAFGRWLDRLEGTNRYEPILLAVDTLLSFVLISGMIWFHAIPELGFPLSRIWEFAVVCQIIGVGVSRVLYVINNPVNS